MAEADNFGFKDAAGVTRSGRAQAFGNQVFGTNTVVTARKTVLGCKSTTVAATAKALGAAGIDIPAGATHALVSIDGAAVRMRDDNVDPTTSVGLYAPDGSVLEFCLADLTDVAFIAVTGTANINVSYYKYDS